MNSNRAEQTRSVNAGPKAAGWKMRRSLTALPIAVVILLGVLLGWKQTRSRTGKEQADPRPPGHAVVSSGSQAIPAAGRPVEAPHRKTAVVPSAVTAPVPAPTASDLVARMVRLSTSGGPITAEQAARFTEALQELVHGGAASVPAIRDFLTKNVDVAYSEITGGEQLGYSSLRAALIETLKQIGGPEAGAAMLELVQTTAVPGEVLELAKDLEQRAPGQFRDQILNAARDALTMATANQLGTNVEVGPAFRVLQNYAGAETVAGAAQEDPFNFYNAIALANMPEAKGLPSLLQMAQTPDPNSSGQMLAVEMIGQLAGQSPNAFDALMQMAQRGQIGNSQWEKLAPILGGEQYQLGGAAPGTSPVSTQDPNAEAGQGFRIVDGATSPDQINARIELINKFLNVVAQDSAAGAALMHERGILQSKLGR